MIDSAGVGELVASHKLCQRLGSEVRLLRLHGRVRETLQLAALLPVFKVHDDEKQALRQLGVSEETSPVRRKGPRTPEPSR